MNTDLFTINCTGDACVGGTILFTETVWGGNWKHPTKLGERIIAALIVKDSYGAAKQQHTFTLEVIDSEGYDALEIGSSVRRKGRTVYGNGTKRQPWTDETQRGAVLDEKHARGDIARAARRERKGEI